MAIIDSKLAEEAQRREREYAQRNDTAAVASSQDWQAPPPAYEEASAATGSSSQSQAQESSNISSQRDVEDQSESSAARQREDSMASDETLPLLTRRQQQRRLRKKLSTRERVKKTLRFIIATLLMACILLLLLDLTGVLDADDILPSPIESDGTPIGSPDWSPGVRTDPDYWPNPNTPLYSSFTNFTFDAYKRLFLHEYSNGAVNSGQVNVACADPLSDAEWATWCGGVFFDCVHVQVEARYTEVGLRDAIRVNKMRMDRDKEGVGIYGAKPRRTSSSHTYISFHVFVWLPSERQRTLGGIDQEGSSYISELDLDIDNFRIGIETMQDASRGSGFVSFGDLKTRQSNGGMTFLHGLRANNSIDIHLQNGPVLDLKGEMRTYSMRAPKISINVVNGPIWLDKLVAKDEIDLRTTNGGINITSIAIAKSIKIKHATGVSAGLYRAQDLEVFTSASDTDLTVDLTHDLFQGVPGWEDDATSRLDKTCQRRTIDVTTNTGDVIVNYQNHDPRVELHSLISVKSGSIRVNHDEAFEGTFSVSNKVGTVEIDGPRVIVVDPLLFKQDVERAPFDKKILLITKGRTGSAGNSFEGRTWWPNHSWNDKGEILSIILACINRSWPSWDLLLTGHDDHTSLRGGSALPRG